MKIASHVERLVCAAAVSRSLDEFHLVECAQDQRGEWIVLSATETGRWAVHRLIIPEPPSDKPPYIVVGDYFDMRAGHSLETALEDFQERVGWHRIGAFNK